MIFITDNLYREKKKIRKGLELAMFFSVFYDQWNFRKFSAWLKTTNLAPIKFVKIKYLVEKCRNRLWKWLKQGDKQHTKKKVTIRKDTGREKGAKDEKNIHQGREINFIQYLLDPTDIREQPRGAHSWNITGLCVRNLVYFNHFAPSKGWSH